jgi:hypothetical protein
MPRKQLAAPMLRGALLAALLLLPTALAQLPPLPGGTPGNATARITMELQDPGGPLVPARPYSLQLVVHYQYGPGASVPPDQDIAPSGRICGTVTVPNPPPWALVQVLPPEVCFVVNPTFAVGGTTVDNTTIVEVNATADAPALEPFNFTVVADVPGEGTIAPALGEVSRDLSPGYQGKLAVQGPGTVTVRGGAPQEVPVQVVNQANGPIEVRFRNFTGPQGLRGELPERFVLQRNESRAVPIRLTSPWTTPVRGLVEFQVESSHPTRPDLVGDNPRGRFDVQGKAAVPGLEVPLLLLATLGLAAARRR